MATPFDLALSTYLDHLRIERALSIHSIEGYRRDLVRFSKVIAEKEFNYEELSDLQLSEIIGSLKSNGLALSSINRFISSLKGFYKYVAVEYSIRNPISEVNQFKVSRKLPKALTVAEVAQLIATTDNPALTTALRDRAILEILYGTGARVSELIGIDISDISTDTFEGETITILKLRGKGSKERLVPLGAFAVRAIDDYLVRVRPALIAKGSNRERALLLNAKGTRLTRQSAWASVNIAAELCGLSGRVSPHVFRHSYATHLLDGGADIRVVQELLGHASVTTTQIYTLVTIDRVRESYASAHPRA